MRGLPSNFPAPLLSLPLVVMTVMLFYVHVDAGNFLHAFDLSRRSFLSRVLNVEMAIKVQERCLGTREKGR